LFHLGGGRGSNDDDPLFRFKSLFSHDFRNYYTGRWILNQEVYSELSARRHEEAERLGKAGIDTSYFPVYRAPFITAVKEEPETIPETPSQEGFQKLEFRD